MDSLNDLIWNDEEPEELSPQSRIVNDFCMVCFSCKIDSGGGYPGGPGGISPGAVMCSIATVADACMIGK